MSTPRTAAGGSVRWMRRLDSSTRTSVPRSRSNPVRIRPVTTTSERLVDPSRLFRYSTTSRSVVSLVTRRATSRIRSTTTLWVTVVLPTGWVKAPTADRTLPATRSTTTTAPPTRRPTSTRARVAVGSRRSRGSGRGVVTRGSAAFVPEPSRDVETVLHGPGLRRNPPGVVQPGSRRVGAPRDRDLPLRAVGRELALDDPARRGEAREEGFAPAERRGLLPVYRFVCLDLGPELGAADIVANLGHNLARVASGDAEEVVGPGRTLGACRAGHERDRARGQQDEAAEGGHR